MPEIHLSRRQIGKSSEVLDCELDVTAKSGMGLGAVFAPSWALVKAKAEGTLSEEEYEVEYFAHLRQISPKHYAALMQFGAMHGNRICFLCYCRDGTFCHTYLLIAYLTSEFPNHFSIL